MTLCLRYSVFKRQNSYFMHKPIWYCPQTKNVRVLSRACDSESNDTRFWIGRLVLLIYILQSILITINYRAIASLPTSQIIGHAPFLSLHPYVFFCSCILNWTLSYYRDFFIQIRYGPHRKHLLLGKRVYHSVAYQWAWREPHRKHLFCCQTSCAT
jgi:hypothetical protein